MGQIHEKREWFCLLTCFRCGKLASQPVCSPPEDCTENVWGPAFASLLLMTQFISKVGRSADVVVRNSQSSFP